MTLDAVSHMQAREPAMNFKVSTETAHAQLDSVYNKIKRASPRKFQDQNSGEIRPISFRGEWRRRQFQPQLFHLAKVEFVFKFKLLFFILWPCICKFAHRLQLFTHNLLAAS